MPVNLVQDNVGYQGKDALCRKDAVTYILNKWLHEARRRFLLKFNLTNRQWKLDRIQNPIPNIIERSNGIQALG